jgi:DNA-binding response OmpR family regulator
MESKKKILFVDDDKDFGVALTHFFADKPFTLLFAHTLSDGMAMMETERPEHIFLDNSLPDGMGWEKTEFILAHYPQVHLNLLSALGVPKTSSSTFRILEKPISLDELLSCLA